MKFSLVLIGALALICGIQALPQSFILNGSNSNVNPYYAHIVYLNVEQAGFFGGGVIISPTHILTAGHMVHNFVSWNIGVGSNNQNQLTRFTTTTGVVHPSYNPTNRAYDLGILTLLTPLIFSANVRPAALPPLVSTMPSTNEEGRAYGFGYTAAAGPGSNVLQMTFQRVTNHTRCAQSFVVTEASQFCALDSTHSSNLCFGDLGGGFFVQYFGVDTVMGIASMVTDACSIAHPTAYARVSHGRQWILTITQQ